MLLNAPNKPLEINRGAPIESQVDAIEQNIQTLWGKMDYASNPQTSPLLAEHPLSKLNPDRLVYTNGKSEVTSVSQLSQWVQGTNGQINVKDLGNGRVKLSLPNTVVIPGAIVVPGITVTSLTPLRLVASDAASALVSVGNLTAWVAGTANQVNVADDGDGTITLSTPQDIAAASSPTFTGLTLSGLTPTRLVQTNAGNTLTSVANLTAWVAGTANRVTVADDGDGTITLSGPQDLAAASSPTFTGLTLSGLTASRLVATNGASALASVAALTAWVAGTANQVNVTDDLDGSITLSTPQDIHTGATPQFAGGTFNGNVSITTGAEIRLYNGADTFYTGFEAPNLAGNQIYVLPLVDGAPNEFLQTNGAGTLIWAAAGGGAPGGANTNVQYNNGGAFGGDAGFIYDGAGTATTTVAFDTDVYQINGTTILQFDAGHNIYLGDAMNLLAGGSCLFNILIGTVLGRAAASGAKYNIGMGYLNFTNLTNGDGNISLGYRSAENLTTATNNVMIGYLSGQTITTGASNILIGASAGNAISTGNRNVLIGTSAGAVLTGSDNTFVGYRAGDSVTTGTDNLLFGSQTGGTLTTGSQNTLIGIDAGAALTTQSDNTLIGKDAGLSLTSASNVMIGSGAGRRVSTTLGNVIIGYQASYQANDASNVVIGYQANYSAVGATNRYNVVIGLQAAYSAGSGFERNIVLGYQAGYDCEDNDNIYIGYRAAQNNTGGKKNVMIGALAGINSGNADACVYIGYDAGDSATTSNRLYIQNSGSTTPLIYGEFDNDIIRVHGNLEYRNASFSRCDGYVHREPAELTTANAVQTTLDSITLLDENTYHVKAFVVGVKSDGSERASYEIAVTVYRTGAGNATIQGVETILHSQESDATWDATFTVNGNDLRVSVTGVAATTIYWAGTLHYINTSN